MSDDVNSNAPVEGQQENVESVSSEQSEVSSEASSSEVSFLDSIPEELRDQGNLRDFKDVGSLAKSYVEAQKMLGSSVRIPGNDAADDVKSQFIDKIKGLDDILVKPRTAEEKEAFYNKLGRPETKDGYSFDEFLTPEIKSSIPNLDSEVEIFKDSAFKLGLTEEQSRGIVEMRTKALGGHVEQLTLAGIEAEQKLRNAWGSDYDGRIKSAELMFGALSQKFPNEAKVLWDAGAGRNALFLNMLSEVAGSYGEDELKGLSAGNGGIDPSKADKEIESLFKDKEFQNAYFNAGHKDHKSAVDKYTGLAKARSKAKRMMG